MRLLLLAWRSLWARPLVATLNLLLLSLGLGAMCFVILASEQLEATVERELAGIDLVVGAKGSPLQLILSGVFHLDAPSGNIPFSAVKTLAEHPMVERVIPLSLGDALQGYRIVGTTADYPALYGASLSQGRLWAAPLEAVLGAEVAQALGLRIGDTFAGAHGLGEGGAEHGAQAFRVVGLLARQGGVLDRLVLTSTESIWAVHEQAHGARAEPEKRAPGPATPSPQGADKHGDAQPDEHPDEHDDEHSEKHAAMRDSKPKPEAQPADAREVTVLLVQYKTPLAAVSVPRWVNRHDALQSAAPAMEMARLLKLVNAGTEVLRAFGLVLLLAGGLSVFIGLYHAVRERQSDLAMMRMLGAPPWRVAALVSAEAVWLAVLGLVLGLALGHSLVGALGWYLQGQRSVALTGLWLSPWEMLIPLFALAVALLAAAIPTWRAFRLDVMRLLQTP